MEHAEEMGRVRCSLADELGIPDALRDEIRGLDEAPSFWLIA
jgi:hypothetical protein